MRRWAFGLVLAAVAALSVPAPVLAAAPDEAEAAFLEWLEMAIERGEWRLASLGPGAAIFIRIADKPATSGPRLWVRLELQRPVFPSGTLSMTQLLEFDCPGRRTRTLEGVSYRLNNLAGEGAAQEHDGDWSTVSPEQALDRVVNVACETRRLELSLKKSTFSVESSSQRFLRSWMEYCSHARPVRPLHKSFRRAPPRELAP